MIVKNEGKNIKRLLHSVVPIVDCYCICDTGSTDDTVEIITQFAEKHGWTGKVVYKSFVNFEFNRNYALIEARKLKPDYILLLDADMVLMIDKFDKSILKNPAYCLKQHSGSLVYDNVRLISGKEHACYKGVTHEYLDIRGETLQGIWIKDIGDGGAKADKFERDIRLLKQGLLEEPTNVRYMFYLANSYSDHGDNAEAVEMYKTRILNGGWDEEVYYCHLRMGICYKRLGQYDKMIQIWLEGWNYRPTRMETLYELMIYFKEKKQYELGLWVYDKAKDIPMPNDRLFVNKEMYSYKLHYEYSLLAYYGGRKNIHKCYQYLFNAPELVLNNQFHNYKFYYPIPKLIHTYSLSKNVSKFKYEVEGNMHTFYGSTPSIIPYKNGYLVNIKCVNYTINSNGSYNYQHNLICSLNYKVELNKTMNIISENILDLTIKESVSDRFHNNMLHKGFDNLKLHVYHDKIYYLATLFDNNKYISIGEYAIDEYKCLTNIVEHKKVLYEKKWVFMPDQLSIIHQWYPLQYGHIEEDKLVITNTIEMPKIFEMARGSTNGYAYKDEYWFVVHFYNKMDGEPRIYYHSLVKFTNQMKLIEYTLPFKFSNKLTEHCLGLIVEDDRIIISHSAMDSSSMISIYEKTFDWVKV